jgi:hypothetical protein
MLPHAFGQGIELGLAAAYQDDMRAKPREQPRDRAANSACCTRDHHHHAPQRIGREYRPLNGEFVIREAERFRRRLRIGVGRLR